MVNRNKCKEEFSRPDSLSQQLKRKNSCTRIDFIVEQQNTCSVPYKPETVMGTGVKRQYGASKVHNQQHNKMLIDSIIDEEHSPKKKFLPNSKIFPVEKTPAKLMMMMMTLQIQMMVIMI